MSLSHREFLQQAEDLYQAELNKVAQQETQLETANARILALEAEIEDLTKPPEPIPVYLWKDEFTTAPTDERYIRACWDPAQNFVLDSPGNLRVVFIAGKTGGPHASAATNKILRSELMLRQPGTNNAIRQEIGKGYKTELAFTIPADFAPVVPNEAMLVAQFWQSQDVKPPVQLQLIDPATTPDPLIMRLVLSSPQGSERKVWKMPVTKGKRYDVELFTWWSLGQGNVTLIVNGAELFEEDGPNCYDRDAGMALHFGQYLPGSADNPVGSRTDLIFHYVKVQQL